MNPSLSSPSTRHAAFRSFAGPLLLCLSTATWAAPDLVVRVSGIRSPLGQIGCALFADGSGFPMDSARAQQQWIPAQADGVTCRFGGVAPGRYAVSVVHDLNGNRRVDTNFLGMPTEQWGVSNNARPTLRAPRFDEAAFTVPAESAELVLGIEVAK
jgi:uncharacterized protein (DUF2141 family)